MSLVPVGSYRSVSERLGPDDRVSQPVSNLTSSNKPPSSPILVFSGVHLAGVAAKCRPHRNMHVLVSPLSLFRVPLLHCLKGLHLPVKAWSDSMELKQTGRKGKMREEKSGPSLHANFIPAWPCLCPSCRGMLLGRTKHRIERAFCGALCPDIRARHLLLGV